MQREQRIVHNCQLIMDRMFKFVRRVPLEYRGLSPCSGTKPALHWLERAREERFFYLAVLERFKFR